MNILDKIMLNKRKEIALFRRQTAFREIEKSRLFSRATYSLSDSILNSERYGIIAEFKRKSPSAGVINPNTDGVNIIKGYSGAGASGLSILTDKRFFGGSCADIFQTRDHINIPVLRKEFVIDEIQVLETKAVGADAILLIATILEKTQIRTLAKLSRSLGLEVLFEIHSMNELEKVNEYVNIIGVNNRNLGTLKTNVQLSEEIADKIPSEFVRISESGISDPQTVINLRKIGYNGFLIGEFFMSKPDPVNALADFVQKIGDINQKNKLQG